jgi:molecular chaperone DnaK
MSLGRFQLTDIPPAPRGVPQIEVTFDIDANGIINVSASDKGTGKEQKIKIESGSKLSDEEIERMKSEAKANEESDREKLKSLQILNDGDSMIFQTEKMLKEHSDKVSEEDKAECESIISEMKSLIEAKDSQGVSGKMESLNTILHKISSKIYESSNTEGGSSENDDNTGEEVFEDVSYEESK